jgi:hypothetical protein
LIADALLVRGIEVREISNASRTRLHALTPWAQVNGTQVSYPGDGSGMRIEASRTARVPG